MSILIKGMEMPTNKFGKVLIIYPNGEVVACEDTKYEAVLVPPHGDLIDRAVLDVIGYCGIPQGHEDIFDSGVMWLAEQIDGIPTIIPAEEGK